MRSEGSTEPSGLPGAGATGSPNDKRDHRRHLLWAIFVSLAFLIAAPVPAADAIIDAALAQARIGEQSDGYLGFVEPPSASLQKAVSDINIRRREGYTKSAIADHVTIAEFAAATACRIFQQLAVGRAYRIGDQPWRVHAAGEEVVAPGCG